MKIVAYSLYCYELPLIKPIQVAWEKLQTRKGVILELKSDEGKTVYGEIAPLPGLSFESLMSVMQELIELRDHIIGISPETLGDLKLPIRSPSVLNGIEMAVWQLLGGKQKVTSIPLNALISPESLDECVSQALSLKANGYRSIKLKVGRSSIPEDIERVRTLREVLGDQIQIRLDANGVWSLAEAIKFACAVESCKIEYIEDPVLELNKLPAFYQESGMKYAIDHSITELDLQIDTLDPGLDALIVKPCYVGGLGVTYSFLSFAHKAGIKAVMSSSFESGLSLHVYAQFVAQHGDPQIPVGLDTVGVFQRDLLETPLETTNGLLYLQEKPIALNHDLLSPLLIDKKVACMVSQAAWVSPQASAFVSDDFSLSYQSFHTLVTDTVKKLTKNGWKSKDRLLIQSDPCVAYVILLHACLRMGVVIFPCSTRIPSNEAEELWYRYACAGAFVGKGYSLNGAAVLTEMIPVEGVSTRKFSPNHFPLIPWDSDATILMTSGSSGAARAVLHSYENHYFSALGSAHNIPFFEGDRWLLSLPLYHVGGLSLCFRFVLGAGSLAFAHSIVDSLKSLAITHLSLVSTQFVRLMKNNETVGHLRSLCSILLGGSAIPRPLIARACKLELPIHISYGSTELASQVATTCCGANINALSYTSGCPLPYRQVKISSDGEVYLKGKTLFKAYLNQADLAESPFTEDGWFRSGDLGSLDKKNRLCIEGRKDLMFISGGENIYPEEIEKILISINGVEKVIVVPIPDYEFGFRPVAFIDIPLELDEAFLRQTLLKHLPSFKVPLYFFAWSDDDADSGEMKIDRQYFKLLALIQPECLTATST